MFVIYTERGAWAETGASWRFRWSVDITGRTTVGSGAYTLCLGRWGRAFQEACSKQMGLTAVVFTLRELAAGVSRENQDPREI